MIFDPNDPRLTAYALDELDPAGRAEIDLLLVDCEEARNHIAEIRQTAQLLAEELKKEPLSASSLMMANHRLIDQAINSAVPRSKQPLLVAQALQGLVDGGHPVDWWHGRIGRLE